MATKKKPMKKAKAMVKAKPTTIKKNKSVMKVAARPAAKMTAKPAAKMTAKPATRAAKAKLHLSPLEDRVIVRVADAEEMTEGGLFIPGNATTRPNRGEVVATGPGRRNKKGQVRPLDVSVGDNVLFPQYSGTHITVDDQEFLILREEEVLGIVT